MAKRIIIIGGGPGGYVAAIRAAQLGAEVLVVEKDELGGVCLNRGCLPTKALLHSARLYGSLKDCRRHGIYGTIESVRFDEMVARKDEVVRNNVTGIHTLFRKNRVDYVKGIGRLADPRTVTIAPAEGSAYNQSADAVVLATGSQPLIPGFIKPDGDRIITTTEALNLDRIPSSIAIVGGSVSGCEFAALFAQLDAKVFLIEMMDRIVPTEDKEISRRLAGHLKRIGVKVMTQTALQSLERRDSDGPVKILTAKGSLEAEYCLLAMGRKLNTADIGLEGIDLEHSPRGIRVNERMETSQPGVYAVGDVTGRQLLAHVAGEQGVTAVENIMGRHAIMDYRAVPGFIYTQPEIGSVGLKKDEAEEMGLDCLEGKAVFKTNSMAHVLEETSGFVKVLAERASGKIVGVHIMGPNATDLLAEAAVMVRLGLTIDDVKSVIHPHPTISETVKEAVLAAAGEAIHAV